MLVFLIMLFFVCGLKNLTSQIFFVSVSLLVLFSQFNMNTNIGLFNFDYLSLLMLMLTLWMLLVMKLMSIKYGGLEGFSYSLMVYFLIFFLALSFIFSSYFGFYVFFELSLLPLLCLILMWGYQNERLQASFYLFFYTMAGSLPLLLLFIYYFFTFGSGSWWFFLNVWIEKDFFQVLFFFTMFSFFIKTPLFLVHLWLPKAHVEAPAAGSMVLAALLLKLGGYGVYRFLFLFHFFKKMSVFFLCFSLWGAFLCSLICLIQADLKALVAYSSISHMGVMVSGLFNNLLSGVKGFSVIVVGHAFCSSALFFLVGFHYERHSSRQVLIIRGFSSLAFLMGVFWFFFLAANFAAPPFITLLGEISVFFSIIYLGLIVLFLLGFLSFFVAFYCVFLYSNIYHGHSYKSVGFWGEMDFYFLILSVHAIPLVFFVLKSDMFF